MNPAKNFKDISALLAVGSSEEVLGEVLEILKLISSDFDKAPVRNAYQAAERLYSGRFPGYRPCNTGYHDFRHAVESFLAMSRFIHGAVLDGASFDDRQIITALIAAIFHDAGYIQQDTDTRGTGAKHKSVHEQRSMEFLSRHGLEYGLLAEEIAAGRIIILCTDMDADIAKIAFPSAQIEMLGKLLGAADLMAQLAERSYLEKLLVLYDECKEAGIDDYASELDFVRQAVHFYDIFNRRLKTALDGVDRYVQLHFASRWSIDKNLYHEAINKHKNYLVKLIKIPDLDPRTYLRRGGIVKKIYEGVPKDSLKH